MNQEHRLALRTLLDAPREWKLISSMAPADSQPIEHPQAQEWLQKAHKHRHPYPQIMVAYKGQGCVVLNDKVFPVAPGTLILINTLETHLGILAHTPLNFLRANILSEKLSMRFYTFNLDSEPVDNEHEYIHLALKSNGYLRERCSELSNRSISEGALKRGMLLHAIGSLLVEILERWSEAYPTALPSTDEVVQSICTYLWESGGVGASIDDLATAMEITRHTFLKLFQEHTGQSFRKFSEQCKVNKIREMEKQGYSRKEIGAALGFSYASTFSRWYSSHILVEKNDE